MNALLLDRIAPIPGSPRPQPLLTLPLGRDTLLQRIAKSIPSGGDRRILITPMFSYARDYEERISRSVPEAEIVCRDAWPTLAERLNVDPADAVVIVDARRWPEKGFPWRGLSRVRPDTAVAHGYAHCRSANQIRERIEYDSAGHIRGVSRLFEKEGLSETALTITRVPIWCLRETTFESLEQLRERLVARGILSADTVLDENCIDLTNEGGLLTMQERALAPMAEASARRQPTVSIGARCEIAESATLVGAVVVEDEVRIHDGVKVVGPVTIGRGSEIGRDAIIVHSLICAGSRVSPAVTIYGRVISGKVDENALSAIPRSGDRYGDSGSRFCSRDMITRSSPYTVVKRAMDFGLAFAGLLAIAPLLMIVAVMVRLDSPGPVLYAQRREGRHGRLFGCLKFRTMVHNAHRLQTQLAAQNEVDGPQFKIRRDPRITTVGRILRATNVDELPQLINVVLGQMSLVGPRPSPPRENRICVPWRRARLSVQPGITGLWQICRHRQCDGDFHEWIHYDLAYVRNLSLWLDVKILAATALTLGGQWRIPLLKSSTIRYLENCAPAGGAGRPKKRNESDQRRASWMPVFSRKKARVAPAVGSD